MVDQGGVQGFVYAFGLYKNIFNFFSFIFYCPFSLSLPPSLLFYSSQSTFPYFLLCVFSFLPILLPFRGFHFGWWLLRFFRFFLILIYFIVILQYYCDMDYGYHEDGIDFLNFKIVFALIPFQFSFLLPFSSFIFSFLYLKPQLYVNYINKHFVPNFVFSFHRVTVAVSP